MYCSKCGALNDDDARFCAVCGTPMAQEPPEQDTPAENPPEQEPPVQDPPEQEPPAEDPPEPGSPEPEPPAGEAEAESRPARRRKLPRILGICAAAAVVLALTASAVLSSPQNLVARGLVRSAKAIMSSDLAQTAAALEEHGKCTVEVDGKDFAKALGYEKLDGSLSVSYYSRAENHTVSRAVSANASLGDAELCDALFWITEDSIGVSSDVLLDGTAYGVNLKKLSDTLPGSVFDPDSDTYYSLDEDIYDLLTDSGLDEKSLEEWSSLIEDTVKDGVSALRRSIKKHADIDKSTETLTFGDEKAKVTAVTVSAEEEEICAMVEDMVRWAADSKPLKKLLTKIEEDCSDDSIESLSGYRFSAEDLTEEFYDLLDDILDDLDPDDFEDIDGTVSFYIARGSRQLLGFDCALAGYGEKYRVSLLAGPTLSAPTEITLRYQDTWSKYSASYTVSENNAKSYAAKLKVKEGSETVLSGSLSWDKKDGGLKLVLGDTLTVKANMLHKGKTTTIKVKSLSYETYWDRIELDDPGVTITLEEDARFADIPGKYTDLTDFTDEDDFEALLDELSDAVWELVYAVEDELYYW